MSALDALLQGTDYDGWNKLYTTKDDGQTPLGLQNLVTVSRYELQDKQQYYNKLVGCLKWRKVTAVPPPQDAEDLEWPKPLLYCKVKLGNGAHIHTINVHMKSMKPTNIEGQQDPQKDYLWKTHEGWAEGYFISAVKRLGQALETRILLRNIFKQEPGALIVVAGDFNADVDSVPFTTIMGSIKETNNPDIGHEVMVPCELNVPEDRRYSLFHMGHGQMIDHVMVSKGLFAHWGDTDIYNEILPDESIAFASDVKFPESDHAPVVATFRLPDDLFA